MQHFLDPIGFQAYDDINTLFMILLSASFKTNTIHPNNIIGVIQRPALPFLNSGNHFVCYIRNKDFRDVQTINF